MNFKKLQKIQAKLDEEICLAYNLKECTDTKFNKSAVALSVSISDIADTSEHFHFKKRSIGKIDDVRYYRSLSNNSGEEDGLLYDSFLDNYVAPEKVYHLNLLEKCLDSLQFILSLANQAEHELQTIGNHYRIEDDSETLEKNYLFIQQDISELQLETFSSSDLETIVDVFFIYINQLGITADELEQAYYAETSHLVVMEG